MPAAKDTAAQFFHQTKSPALSVNGAGATVTNIAPLPCTITEVLTGGSRVNVVIENGAQAKQSPAGVWSERNVPYVAAGQVPPASGPFVTAVGYAIPVDGTTHLPNGTQPSQGGAEEAGA